MVAPKFYLVKDVAKMLQVQQRKVYELIAAKRLEAVNLCTGGRATWRITAEAIARFTGVAEPAPTGPRHRHKAYEAPKKYC